DAFGRLREVIRPNGGSGSVVAYYHYDARGRRVYRAADVNRNGNANEHCRYIYDGDRLIEERDGQSPSSLKRVYVWGALYVDELLWKWTASGPMSGEHIYGQDESWNVVLMMHHDGDVIHQIRYDAYGEFTIHDENGD